MCPSYTPGLLKGNVTFPESEDIIAVHVAQVGLKTRSFPDSKHWNSRTHITFLHNLQEHFFCGFLPQEKPIVTQCCLWDPPSSATFRSNARDLTRLIHVSWSQAKQAVRGAECPPFTGSGQQNTGKKCVQYCERVGEETGVISWLAFLVMHFCPHPSHIPVYDRRQRYLVHLTWYFSILTFFKENYFIGIVSLQLYEQTLT